MRLKRKVQKYTQARDSDDCGPTCIRMALNSYLPQGGKLSKNNLPGGRKTNAKMKQIVREKGFYFEEISWKSKEESLQFMRKSVRENKPIILSCNADFKHYNRDKHFIILIGIDENDDGYIYVKDPYPEKPEKIEIKSFLRNNQPISWGNSRWGIAVFRTGLTYRQARGGKRERSGLHT